MDVTATLGDQPSKPQTLADLDDGVLATVEYHALDGSTNTYCRYQVASRVYGLSEDDTGHPLIRGESPDHYKIIEVHGPLKLEFHE